MTSLNREIHPGDSWPYVQYNLLCDALHCLLPFMFGYAVKAHEEKEDSGNK